MRAARGRHEPAPRYALGMWKLATVALLLASGCTHHAPRREPDGYALFELVQDGQPLRDSPFHLWVGANHWFVLEIALQGEWGPAAIGVWERTGQNLVFHLVGKPDERYLLVTSRGRTYLIRHEELPRFCGEPSQPFALRLWRGEPPLQPSRVSDVCPPP